MVRNGGGCEDTAPPSMNLLSKGVDADRLDAPYLMHAVSFSIAACSFFLEWICQNGSIEYKRQIKTNAARLRSLATQVRRSYLEGRDCCFQFLLNQQKTSFLCPLYYHLLPFSDVVSVRRGKRQLPLPRWGGR